MSFHAGIGIRSTAAMHRTKNRAPQPIVVQSTPIARQHSHEASGMMRTASRTVTPGPPAEASSERRRPRGRPVPRGRRDRGGVRRLHQAAASFSRMSGRRLGIANTMNHATPNCTHTSPTEMAWSNGIPGGSRRPAAGGSCRHPPGDASLPRSRRGRRASRIGSSARERSGSPACRCSPR